MSGRMVKPSLGLTHSPNRNSGSEKKTAIIIQSDGAPEWQRHGNVNQL